MTLANPLVPHSSYRPDIDGLRAFAVVSVLLFHAFPQTLSGGFVGVDVFFVISGYLISTILVREVQERRFSILQFYIRRARRIFPALLVVLAATLATGWLMLFPDEWRRLGKHVAAGAAFVSNGALWLESGYFDSDSELKPLLHLWSLAVEEQFYLLWPLAIFVAAQRGLRFLSRLTLFILAISLLGSAVLTARNPTLAFYFPGTRFWELLVGGVLAIWQARHAQRVATSTASAAPSTTPARSLLVPDVMGLAALAALVASVGWLTQAQPFPGYVAALPVLGTALAIAAGPQALVNRWILAQPVMVWVGLISYPLYLWHWPLLALARVWQGEHGLSAPGRAALLGLAVLLAWLTYRWVESPLRGPARQAHASRDAQRLWIALLLIGALGVTVWRGTIAPRSAHNPLVPQIDRALTDWADQRDQTWPGTQPGRVLFVGDSHMEHYTPRIAAVMAEHAPQTYSATVMALSGCAPIPGINRRQVACAAFTEHAYQAMQASDVKTVVLAASWKGFSVRPDYYRTDDPTRSPVVPLTDASQWVMDAWTERLRALVQQGKRVVVVLSSPRGDLVEPHHFVARSLWAWDQPHLEPRRYAQLHDVVADVDARVAAAARQAGAEVVDPFASFCHDQVCDVRTQEGEPIFIDDSHIRASYARQHVHYLDPYFRAPTARATPASSR